jgi:3-oxoacyl-[acyl-carrier protein] reductase
MFSKMTKYQQVAGRTTLFAGFRPSLSRPKAALTGLVRGAAIDLAPRAITVNNVQPGPKATDMASAHADDF